MVGDDDAFQTYFSVRLPRIDFQAFMMDLEFPSEPFSMDTDADR
jgi:hypothetical protein